MSVSGPIWILFNYRTSSLPNFFGSFVTQQEHQQHHPADTSKDVSSDVSMVHSGSDTQQFLLTKPPPQYEEATKQLKVKQVSTNDMLPLGLFGKVFLPCWLCTGQCQSQNIHKTKNKSVLSIIFIYTAN
jgi:hypothetical protein